ncbi:hypothetical protein F503_05256 [Ophiostoma piceae UAMH 11346]|uniref:Uncharacterized protein n=1 Tax=Ophiostoma piceae (strain UAMH 11346) TaxID=1262450 RepID=S3CDR7_OPHP1|nr:hypothetical protein F503_05256 [Ophiostoma piceae UAMH 11346]
MSRQSIRNVLRASGNALHGDVAAARLRTPPSLSPFSPIACSYSSTSSLSSTSSVTARTRRSTTPSSTLSRALAAHLLPSSCQGHVRLLSSTAPRSADAINFTPTSDSQLDTLLEEVHRKIILPSYLNFESRRKIYNNDYKERLRTNPITIDIGGEEHRFSYVNPMEELPNARVMVHRSIGLMKTPADFENLPRLLEGLQRAGRHLRPDDYARMARLAGERGSIYTIIECARSVRRTGFHLDQSEVVSEILFHLEMKAVESNWDEAQTRQALAWSEQVLDLLHDENHGRRSQTETAGSIGAAMLGSTAAVATRPPPPQLTIPLSRDPQLLASRLHLAAVVADKFAEGVDTDGKVSRYATELVQLWPAGGKGLRSLHPAEAYQNRRGEMYYLKDPNKFLGIASPLLYGLETAIRVLGGSQGDSAALVGELQSRRDALNAEVQTAVSLVPGRRGSAIYSKYYGEK